MEDYEVLAAVYIEKGGARDLVPLRGQRAEVLAAAIASMGMVPPRRCAYRLNATTLPALGAAQ